MSSPDHPHQPDEPAPPPGQAPTQPTEPLAPGDPLHGQASDPPPPAHEAPAASAPPTGGAPGPKRLQRATDEQMVAGVAAGLGRYFAVDPILFRIAFAVLAFAGGTGAIAYAALWLLVPAQGETGPSRHSRYGVVALIAVVAVAGVIFGADPFAIFAPGLLLLLLIAAVIVFAVTHLRRDGGDPSRMLASILIVFGSLAAAVVAGIGGGLAAALGGGTVIAALVIAAGVALLVGAFVGRARWLVVPALALGVSASVVAAGDLDIDGGMGERSYRPATVAEIRDSYELGLGDLRVDLRDVDFPTGETQIDVELGLGEVLVLLPENVCPVYEVDLAIGEAEIFGDEFGGVDVALADGARRDGLPRVKVNADVGFGEFRLDTEDRRGDGPPWHEPDRDDDARPVRTGVCGLG